MPAALPVADLGRTGEPDPAITHVEPCRASLSALADRIREYAGLDKKAVLVGQGNKMELWDEDTWLAERDKWLQSSIEEGAVPEEMLRLSL